MSISTVRRAFRSFGRWCLDWLSNSGVTPNQITCIGLILVLANSAFYLVNHNTFWLGVGLSLSFAFDSLDGSVARRQGSASKFGGYLDATVDRYQEIAAYLSIAWVTGYWGVVLFVITGSLLTSYNKARAAIEIPVDNKAWPDLLERPARLSLLCGGLIMDAAIPIPPLFGGRLLYLMLIILAVLTHFTALQRFFRAHRMMAAPRE